MALPSAVAKERIARRRSLTGAAINMWPFLAVLIVILSVFMVWTEPFHYHRWGLGYIDLPLSVFASPEPKAIRENAIRISLARDSVVFFRERKIDIKYLPALIRIALQEGAERKAYFAVDARARYGDANVVVEKIGDGGIREICFLAYKPEVH
jgi:biopolymer transport protein ExbD